MRRRVPSPVRPFDNAPPQVIEAAKRIFTLLWGARKLVSDQVRLF